MKINALNQIIEETYAARGEEYDRGLVFEAREDGIYLVDCQTAQPYTEWQSDGRDGVVQLVERWLDGTAY